MSGPDFDELVGADLDERERDALRRAHELLLAAPPPPELPPSLAAPPGTPHEPPVAALPRGIPRRRLAASLVLAAALALAAFGAGFLLGDSGDGGGTPQADFFLRLQGTRAAPEAVGSLAVLPKDDAGNWPMVLTVRNLPELEDGEYELWLTKKGELEASCGTFVVEGEKTVVTLNAPYRLRRFDGWVVTRSGAKTPLLATARV